jgi:CHAT domain-containing protein
VIGLARGFQIAGATNTVMSLWNVDDAATEYQMSRFYENLRSMTPAAALRAAALAARAKHPDPMKWAAFQIFGVSTVLVTPP